jgi:hypothetical protein
MRKEAIKRAITKMNPTSAIMKRYKQDKLSESLTVTETSAVPIKNINEHNSKQLSIKTPAIV